MYHNKQMMQLIADFYAHIFVFLSDVMSWITEKKRRRLLDSFNEKFFEKFEHQISTITQRSERIRNFAAQCSRAEQRHISAAVEDLRQDIRLGLTGQKRHEAEMAYHAEMIARELYEGRKERQRLMEDRENYRLLADQLKQMLTDKAITWIKDTRATGNERSMSIIDGHSSRFLSRMISIEPPSLTDWKLEDILLSSKHLEDFFYRNRIRLEDDRLGPIGVTSDVVRRLSEWMKNQTPQFLWIEGPRVVADDINNPITVLANRVIQLAEQTQIPTIS